LLRSRRKGCLPPGDTLRETVPSIRSTRTACGADRTPRVRRIRSPRASHQSRGTPLGGRGSDHRRPPSVHGTRPCRRRSSALRCGRTTAAPKGPGRADPGCGAPDPARQRVRAFASASRICRKSGRGARRWRYQQWAAALGGTLSESDDRAHRGGTGAGDACSRHTCSDLHTYACRGAPFGRAEVFCGRVPGTPLRTRGRVNPPRRVPGRRAGGRRRLGDRSQRGHHPERIACRGSCSCGDPDCVRQDGHSRGRSCRSCRSCCSCRPGRWCRR
jgi:hypothetical protein